MDDVTIVALDSSEPDLDYGQVGRARYDWLREQYARPAAFRIFMLHHHLLPIPGTGASAAWSWTPATSSRSCRSAA